MANDLSELTDVQLVHRTMAAERDLVAARFRHSRGDLENTASLRVLRRNIARMKTEQRAREVATGLANGALAVRHAPGFEAGGAARTEAAPAEAKGGFLKGIVDKLKGSE